MQAEVASSGHNKIAKMNPDIFVNPVICSERESRLIMIVTARTQRDTNPRSTVSLKCVPDGGCIEQVEGWQVCAHVALGSILQEKEKLDQQYPLSAYSAYTPFHIGI